MVGLMQDFVIMDMSLRKKLTPIGKGVYRYLEASGILTIPVLELMEKLERLFLFPNSTVHFWEGNPPKRTLVRKEN